MRMLFAKTTYNKYRKKGNPAGNKILMSAVIAAAMLFMNSDIHAQDLDVPYVSTPYSIVESMLNVADVDKNDYVVDLGCGDGRIVISAAKRGAYGHGLDLDPERVKEARENARAAGVQNRVMFLQKDIFKADFSRASVVTMYLLDSINLELRPFILNKLEPGTRIVSLSFDMDEWEPDKTLQLKAPEVSQTSLTSGNSLYDSPHYFVPEAPMLKSPGNSDNQLGGDMPYSHKFMQPHIIDLSLNIGEGAPLLSKNIYFLYYWVVPAKVAGLWEWQADGNNFSMEVKQKFQKLRLNVNANGKNLKVTDKGLKGKRITFTVKNAKTGTSYLCNGRVEGNTIKGKIQIRRKGHNALENWTATRH